MDLLNISFAILVIKVAICVLPGVVGLFLIACSEEKKREMRNQFCNKLFGVSNAVPYPKFARFLYVVGALLFVFSLASSWFLLLRGLV